MPGHNTKVPATFERRIISCTASAATMLTACPELCPSPCPGAPSISGSCQGMPGFCEALGMQSTSEPSAMTGPPCPCVQRATHALGMPATPRSTVKPFFSSSAVR